MLCVAHFRPVDDVDICWQIQLGKLALEKGQLITQDPFTYTHFGEPVPTVGWLAQVIFAFLFEMASWRGPQWFAVVLFAGVFVLAGRTSLMTLRDEDDSKYLFSLAGAVLLGFLAAMSSSSIRPQLIAIFCFATLLHVVQSKLSLSRQLLILVPVLLIWQNSHPSVMVGVVALIPLLLGAWMGRRAAGGSGRVGSMVVLIIVVGLSQFATPMGTAILALSARNLEVSRDWLHADEWLPVWNPGVFSAMGAFWFSLALSMLMLVKLRMKVRLNDGLMFVFMAGLTFYAARFALFWSVAMVPVWYRWIERSKPKGMFSWPGNVPVSKCIVVVAGTIGLVVSLVIPPVVKSSIYADDMPFKGIAFLKTVLPAGRIYCYREWGGPLIMEGYPNWQVEIDGRLYLFNREDWRDYNRVARGEVSVDEVVENHQPQAFFLRPSFHEKFIALLQDADDWGQVYADQYTIIFLPSDDSRDEL